jgi:hypothetical protein
MVIAMNAPGPLPAETFPQTAIHEFGHNCFIYHRGDVLNPGNENDTSAIMHGGFDGNLGPGLYCEMNRTERGLLLWHSQFIALWND